QLGIGTTAQSLTPVAVRMPPGMRFTAIAAGNYDSFALDQRGRAWAWGFNDFGELGDAAFGPTAGSTSPVAVSMPASITFTTIAAGGELALALDSAGRAWAWGYNGGGELGRGPGDSARPCAKRTGVDCSPV